MTKVEHERGGQSSRRRGRASPRHFVSRFAIAPAGQEGAEGRGPDATNRMSRTFGILWIAYLACWAGFFFTVEQVSAKDILLASALEVPLLQFKVSFLTFFWGAPILFLAMYLYIVHKALLIKETLGRETARVPVSLIRHGLDGFAITRAFAGVESTPAMTILNGVITIVTLVALPVAFLVLVQARFLPYHSEWGTWWHRLHVLSGLIVASILLWSYTSVRGVARFARSAVRLIYGFVAGGVAAASMIVLTFPGERIATEYATALDEWIEIERVIVFEKGEVSAGIPGAFRVDLRGRRLEGAQLAGADLRRTLLDGASLDRADLHGARLEGAVLNGARLRGTNLSEANLTGAEFNRASMQGAQLVGATLLATRLDMAQLQGADLTRAELSAVSLRSADLHGVSAKRARFLAVDVTDSSFDHSNLSEVAFWRVFGTGVTALDVYLAKARIIERNPLPTNQVDPLIANLGTSDLKDSVRKMINDLFFTGIGAPIPEFPTALKPDTWPVSGGSPQMRIKGLGKLVCSGEPGEVASEAIARVIIERAFAPYESLTERTGAGGAAGQDGVQSSVYVDAFELTWSLLTMDECTGALPVIRRVACPLVQSRRAAVEIFQGMGLPAQIPDAPEELIQTCAGQSAGESPVMIVTGN